MNHADTIGESETVLGDLELTWVLAVQMTVISTLGLVVAWAVFSVLYHAGTGQPSTVWSVSTDVGWWTEALNLLTVLFLEIVFVVPHEWLHGLAIRYYGGKAGTASDLPISFSRTPTRRRITNLHATSSSSSS